MFQCDWRPSPGPTRLLTATIVLSQSTAFFSRKPPSLNLVVISKQYNLGPCYEWALRKAASEAFLGTTEQLRLSYRLSLTATVAPKSLCEDDTSRNSLSAAKFADILLEIRGTLPSFPGFSADRLSVASKLDRQYSPHIKNSGSARDMEVQRKEGFSFSKIFLHAEKVYAQGHRSATPRLLRHSG